MIQDFLYQRLQDEENRGNEKVSKEMWEIIKREHTMKMWRSINDECQRKSGGTITEVDINMNGHCAQKDKQS